MARKDDTPPRDKKEYDPMDAFRNLTPAVWMSEAWIGVLAEMGTQISTFVTRRIAEDMQTQQALLACKTPEEVRHVQAEFFQKAFDQYHEETGKLVELSAQMSERLKSDAKKP